MLQPLLGYTQWRRFENAMRKAITSCDQSGNDRLTILPAPAKRFTGSTGGSAGSDRLPAFPLRLLSDRPKRRPAQAGDCRHQKYFAIQTRRQDLSDQWLPDLERLELRSKRPKSSRHFPVLLVRRACKAACSASSTTPATRDSTAGWAPRPSRPANASPKKSNSWIAWTRPSLPRTSFA